MAAKRLMVLSGRRRQTEARTQFPLQSKPAQARPDNTLIYSILYSDVGSHGGRTSMMRMAKGNGRRVFRGIEKASGQPGLLL